MEELRRYLSTLTPAQQSAYAIRSGTTIGYLRKSISVGTTRFDGALVKALHKHSRGAVPLHSLRPDIWDAPRGR